MDISDALTSEQEELVYALAPKMFGDALLVSHAIVRQWDKDHPMTLSAAGLGRLRNRLPDTLLISDDMQMQGLQKALGTREAGLQSLKAGMDMLCIGNNLFDQEQEMAGIAQSVEQCLRDQTLAGSAIGQSIARVRTPKAPLAARRPPRCRPSQPSKRRRPPSAPRPRPPPARPSTPQLRS